MKKLRVLLADDHIVMRAGLRALLDRQPNLEVVGECENGRETVELAASLEPDVVGYGRGHAGSERHRGYQNDRHPASGHRGSYPQHARRRIVCNACFEGRSPRLFA